MDTNTKTGAELIAAERQRQIEVEGYNAEQDEMHLPEELMEAGLAYGHFAAAQLQGTVKTETLKAMSGNRFGWPWHNDWWKPSDDVKRNMAKSGALIAAAIDRAKAV